MSKRITVLGSTGSIGRQALEVIASHPEEMTLFGIAARASVEQLLEQAHRFRPRYVACETPLERALLPAGTEAIIGADASERLAEANEADTVVLGISGFAALGPLLKALRQGKRVALANKESIVCGKALTDDALAQYGGEIIPVDSEQSAIFQCLQGGRRAEVAKLILTASGGPFWRMEKSELEQVTPNQAASHPTWRMGRKITIDSATLFNKGLEVLEAAYLFDFDAEHIDVLIHPQSIVHSMVAYRDGTVIANMSRPDMRLPIQYALTYPERRSSVCAPLQLALEEPLSFHRPDLARFGALRLAYEALRQGGTYPTAYNGANEAAVEAFCDGRIGFLDIERTVDYTLSGHSSGSVKSLEDVIDADRRARALALKCVGRIARERRHTN